MDLVKPFSLLNRLGLAVGKGQSKGIPEDKHEHKDHLTALPPKLLIKILSQVPLTSYLYLCHTSKDLKDFL
jgi:hypothetical protein